jgi:hypothetical protein
MLILPMKKIMGKGRLRNDNETLDAKIQTDVKFYYVFCGKCAYRLEWFSRISEL